MRRETAEQEAYMSSKVATKVSCVSRCRGAGPVLGRPFRTGHKRRQPWSNRQPAANGALRRRAATPPGRLVRTADLVPRPGYRKMKDAPPQPPRTGWRLNVLLPDAILGASPRCRHLHQFHSIRLAVVLSKRANLPRGNRPFEPDLAPAPDSASEPGDCHAAARDSLARFGRNNRRTRGNSRV